MSETPEQPTVNQVARLARIHLDDQQLTSSGEKLEQILEFVSQLEQVELPKDVEPFFGAIESVNAIREDNLQTSVPREKILDNAPESDGEFYLVPPVFRNTDS
ncbi:MAG: Asp-tRNA(Asn)/Glu-tRNA(Gln) amidotransferase subunit GatC [Planctomycetaceae bacterium]|nr:Asp-tRNA(Asn)/Glu-tRNA(Gln) amidotransferase subunit GatC [Planctomycetaceae bacterium]MCP4478070.1 Asp-tRNA(Asn)/Glu-tRNA(Gln) amidotransferase subunit GatC [Planctomycetaceae bacterium]MCP4776578.1 Asp-tRNA(Asn)/Glu-tRNA(Gln) amidotransferase subunit GatC [Planctomycetaceae bacterium]